MNREPSAATVRPQTEQQALKVMGKRLGRVREDLFDVIDDVDRLLPQHSDAGLCEALQDANNGVGRAERKLDALSSGTPPDGQGSARVPPG